MRDGGIPARATRVRPRIAQAPGSSRTFRGAERLQPESDAVSQGAQTDISRSQQWAMGTMVAAIAVLVLLLFGIAAHPVLANDEFHLLVAVLAIFSGGLALLSGLLLVAVGERNAEPASDGTEARRLTWPGRPLDR